MSSLVMRMLRTDRYVELALLINHHLERRYNRQIRRADTDTQGRYTGRIHRADTKVEGRYTSGGHNQPSI